MAEKVAPTYPEHLEKYAKMLKFGIPEVSVRNKMRGDGFDDDIFDKHLNPSTAQNQPDLPEEEEEEENTNESNNEEKEEQKNEFENNVQKPKISEEKSSLKNNENNNELNRIKGEFESTKFVPEANKELKMDTLQSVPIKKTLLIVNTFVVNTAAFLNKFVSSCESKLHKIHTDIERMEISLKILETKLSSIDWLRSAQAGNVPNLPSLQELEQAEFKEEKMDENNNDAPPLPDQPPPEPQKPKEDPLKSDPAMEPWFKMLKFRVPEQAVRNKMGSSGVDPATIDRVIEIFNQSQ